MSKTDDMACKELVEVVSDYVEGTLAEDDRLRFERHLEICPYCVEYVEQFRETIQATGNLGLESIPPQRRQELLEAFRGWRDRRS